MSNRCLSSADVTASEPGVSESRPSLRSRYFLPLLGTQFGGAFNDNLYKSALLMLFTYGGWQAWGLSVNVINNLVAATMILPFFLFAAMAGQYADKYEKAGLIRHLKLMELLVMLLGAAMLWLQSPLGVLLVLFFTGTQSACFSPLKYAILPQHVGPNRLLAANGAMHTATSLAIFLGLIVGSVLVPLPRGELWLALLAVAVALLGWGLSRKIPVAPSVNQHLPIERNPWQQTLRTLAYARRNRMVFCCLFGVSWYWFLGSVYLTQLPNFSRSVLLGEPLVVTLLLCLFVLGVCSGALLAGALSRGRIEPGLVPLAALLVAIFGIDFYWAAEAFVQIQEQSAGAGLHSVIGLWSLPGSARLFVDIVGLGLAGGLYVVPLSALMQSRSSAATRAQIIGANNVLNALFMVLAALFGLLCLGWWELSISQFLVLVTLLHVIFCVLLFIAEPEFVRRLRTMWRDSRG